MGVSKQDAPSKLNGGLGIAEGLAEGMVAGERLGKKVMNRVGTGGSRVLSPSCAVWPAVSHPGWSVCRLGSCSGTEARDRICGDTDLSDSWLGSNV